MKKIWLSVVMAGMFLAGVATTHLFTVEAREPHPKIAAAMNALDDAKKNLQEADRDFKGHRGKALMHVNEALQECRLALEADKN